MGMEYIYIVQRQGEKQTVDWYSKYFKSVCDLSKLKSKGFKENRFFPVPESVAFDAYNGCIDYVNENLKLSELERTIKNFNVEVGLIDIMTLKFVKYFRSIQRILQ